MAPLSGKGCTYTSCRPRPDILEPYATHRPSGENLEVVAYVGMSGVGFWPAPGDSIHSLVLAVAGLAEKRSVPSGEHVSGCSDIVPSSSFVRSSAEPGVSARCEKRPLLPSRSDANRMRSPSRVQMGRLFVPANVNWRSGVAPVKSYTQMSPRPGTAVLPFATSSLCSANCFPFEEIRGWAHGPGGMSNGF